MEGRLRQTAAEGDRREYPEGLRGPRARARGRVGARALWPASAPGEVDDHARRALPMVARGALPEEERGERALPRGKAPHQAPNRCEARLRGDPYDLRLP